MKVIETITYGNTSRKSEYRGYQIVNQSNGKLWGVVEERQSG